MTSPPLVLAVADPATDSLASALAAGLRDAIEADAVEVFPDSAARFEVFAEPDGPGEHLSVHHAFRVAAAHPWDAVLAMLDEVRSHCWQTVGEGWALQWRGQPEFACVGLAQRWVLTLSASFVPTRYSVWKGAEQ